MVALGCGAGAVAGCGGGSQSSTSVAGSGQGVGYRLKQEGLRHCVGPLATTGDPSPASGNPDPVSLAVYAEPGLGALVASGAGAQDHAVNLVVIRNHVAGNRTGADEAKVESCVVAHGAHGATRLGRRRRAVPISGA